MSKVEEKKIEKVKVKVEEVIIPDSEALKLYKQIKATVDAMSGDFDKFENKKVKAAGQRVRNNLLTCKKLSTELRKVLITEIQGIPVKHRTPVVPVADRILQSNCKNIDEKKEEVKEEVKVSTGK